MSQFAAFLIAISALVAGSAHANDAKLQSLTKFTNSHFVKSGAELKIVVDGKGMIKEVVWSAPDNQTVPARHKIEALSARNESGEVKGTVLETYDTGIIGKVETIRLRGGKVDYKKGEAKWTLSLLSDGMSRSYLECPMTMKRTDTGAWQVTDTKGTPVAAARFIVDPNKGVQKVDGLSGCRLVEPPTPQQQFGRD